MSIFTKEILYEFIRKLEELPETKALFLLLLIAEEANKVVIPRFVPLASNTTAYINQCWCWIGDKNQPLSQDALPWDCDAIALFKKSQGIDEALKVSQAVLDYITYKSLETNLQGDGIAQSAPQSLVLEYVFNEVPVQNFLTDEILHLAGLQS